MKVPVQPQPADRRRPLVTGSEQPLLAAGWTRPVRRATTMVADCVITYPSASRHHDHQSRSGRHLLELEQPAADQPEQFAATAAAGTAKVECRVLDGQPRPTTAASSGLDQRSRTILESPRRGCLRQPELRRKSTRHIDVCRLAGTRPSIRRPASASTASWARRSTVGLQAAARQSETDYDSQTIDLGDVTLAMAASGASSSGAPQPAERRFRRLPHRDPSRRGRRLECVRQPRRRR